MQVKLSKATGKVKLVVLNAISKSNQDRITQKHPCKARCANCCFRMVRLTVAEAMVIYSHLIEIKQWGEVQKKLKEQVELSKTVDAVAWFKMRIPCPVLDEETKTCRAYAVRPIFCSTHFVLSDPEVCDPWYVGSKVYNPDYKKSIYDEAVQRIGESLKGNSVLGFELPIQSALLLSERISTRSGLTFEQVIRVISNEF